MFGELPRSHHHSRCFVQETPAVQEASASESSVPENPASFALSFLWLERSVAVAVDQVFGEVSANRFHLTGFSLYALLLNTASCKQSLHCSCFCLSLQEMVRRYQGAHVAM